MTVSGQTAVVKNIKTCRVRGRKAWCNGQSVYRKKVRESERKRQSHRKISLLEFIAGYIRYTKKRFSGENFRKKAQSIVPPSGL